MKHISLILLFVFLIQENLTGQERVGVVLSGGGASGLAHIGVLKALEDNDIPIDYIVGTSIGALVGGLYASGYSPNEIEEIITSEDFKLATTGKIKEEYVYHLKQNRDNPGIINWHFNLDSLFESNIPTNFISSDPIDFGLMQYLAAADGLSNNNFDSLFIPFRCLASNISAKSLAIFKSGNLSMSIRASMTYPFFIAPLSIDGDVMFDGGLYNNFPVDVMCDEFDVDYIIASDVSSELEPADEDNLISQIRNMLIRKQDYNLPCSNGIIIKSKVADISTFDFNNGDQVIEDGYNSTLKKLDSIKIDLGARRKSSLVASNRNSFNQRKPSVTFTKLKTEGIHKVQEKYLKKDIFKSKDSFNLEELEKPFMKFSSDEKIKSIYPEYSLDSTGESFEILLRFKKQKKFRATFGGVFSTKPISTGFFELDYQNLGATGIDVGGNIYFGNFYSSAQAKIKWDLPFYLPFYLESQYTLNQYDYFNSRSSFIEEEDPPYIISSERYAEFKLGLPITTQSKLVLGSNYTWKNYEYYQSNNFNRGDTSDLTLFEGYSTYARLDLNTLNHKIYASKGSRLNLMLRYIEGTEETQPGSTSESKTLYNSSHNWWLFKGAFEKYFFERNSFRLGWLLEGVISNQPFFQNYTATVLNLPQFQPLPENSTLFQPNYRALTYLGGGLRTIYTFNDKLDFRLEGYLFQPYEALTSDIDGNAKLAEEGAERSYIATFTSVYHTRIGPLAASVNYFDDEANEFSFLIHFGFIIYNRKSFE